MDLRDMFGDLLGRPDHPDFWRLAEIVLDFDVQADSGKTVVEINVDNVDVESVAYMGSQRAQRVTAMMHMLGLTRSLTRHQLNHIEMLVGAAWMEACTVGIAFEKRGGKQ